MVNNQTSCVIADYIYNVINYDYDYITSGNGNYWRSCNRLRLPNIPTLVCVYVDNPPQ